jgi:hypothetical protein
VAYRLQERVLGGLKSSTLRLLERTAEESLHRQTPTEAPATKVTPGSVLIREWHGVSHRVTVLGDGVLLRGARATAHSRRWRARSPGPAGRGRASSGCERRPSGAIMEHAKPMLRRCAIYTRKSSEEGLEQNFNSPRPARGMRGSYFHAAPFCTGSQ